MGRIGVVGLADLHVDTPFGLQVGSEPGLAQRVRLEVLFKSSRVTLSWAPCLSVLGRHAVSGSYIVYQP